MYHDMSSQLTSAQVVKKLKVTDVRDGQPERRMARQEVQQKDRLTLTGLRSLVRCKEMLQEEKKRKCICHIPQSCREVASEPGDRLQVTHVATETAGLVEMNHPSAF